MFEHILNVMREQVRTYHYVMTLHAEEEMNDDKLTIYDVESAILTGQIVERQKDQVTGEWKYRIQGNAVDGGEIELVAKLSPTGVLVLVTVYVL